MNVLARVLPPGLTTGGLVLRVVLALLPCAALGMALPEVPHLVVTALVVACSVRWAPAGVPPGSEPGAVPVPDRSGRPRWGPAAEASAAGSQARA